MDIGAAPQKGSAASLQASAASSFAASCSKRATALLSSLRAGDENSTLSFRAYGAGFVYGGGDGKISATLTRVAPDHMDGTPRMNVTKPVAGDFTSPVRRPR
jgi:hypothetical protein